MGFFICILGNGPSGISLSHLLSGHWPYHNGMSHPTNEELNARLAAEPQGLSIIEQDLEFLSQVNYYYCCLFLSLHYKYISKNNENLFIIISVLY